MCSGFGDTVRQAQPLSLGRERRMATLGNGISGVAIGSVPFVAHKQSEN